jgi:hypothetical protein
LNGSVSVPLEKIQEYFPQKLPGLFKGKPNKVYLQLHHHAGERGEGLGLDAWTGDLFSKVMELSLSD